MKRVAFRWGQRRYRIERIHLVYRRRAGGRLFYHFSVTVGADSFDLGFEPLTLEWRVARTTEG